MVTVSAVGQQPDLRIKLNADSVESFQENLIDQGWINGGFFVINSEFLDLTSGDSTMLEREPLEKVKISMEIGIQTQILQCGYKKGPSNVRKVVEWY